MVIKYSRHAKRRMKLYKISERVISTIILKGKKQNLEPDKISSILTIEKQKYPIKIIYKIINNEIVIITCYPLKRKYNHESDL
jgi:hypothetical protein